MRFSICLLFFSTVAAGCEGALPVKEQVVGNCVKESDCGSTQLTCKANTCTGCTDHSDCASGVCDTYGDVGSPGTCVLPERILYVESTNYDGSACAQEAGTQSLPYCSLTPALARLATAPDKILRLLPSPASYLLPAVETMPASVVIIGPGSNTPGKAATLGLDASEGRLQIGSGASLVLDGMVISIGGLAATNAKKIEIRRSALEYMTMGASFEGGTVVLDRVLLTESKTGLSFKSATVSMTNSILSGNALDEGTNLVEFSGGSGTFQLNTVAYNRGTATSMMLSCVNAASVTVKNSIFVQNAQPQQLGAGCKTVANSVVLGTSDKAPDQIKTDPVFEDPATFDLRLKPQSAVNIQALIDKAVEVEAMTEKNVGHDYFGTPRPQGSGYDIGAVEVMP